MDITMSGCTYVRLCVRVSFPDDHLENRKPDCFHIAYTHHLRGVDVSFGGCDF